MKRVYMEKCYLKKHSTNRIWLFTIVVSLLIFFWSVHLCVADTKNQCNARSKLPKHLSHITFNGGNGNGYEQSIVIEHARNTGEGIAAEKVWVKACYPSARIKTRIISHRDNKIYEVIEIKSANNTIRKVFFDITGFFGTW
jgi:hypothetical protein